MARCVFEGLTPEQAVAMSDWFSEQGEQDCEPWFDEAGLKSPTTNGVAEICGNGDVMRQCK